MVNNRIEAKMIFSTDVIKDFSSEVFGNLTTVLVYQGSIPSSGAYAAGFLTTFSWTGTALLQAYNGLDMEVTVISQGYRLYKVGNQYSSYSKQAGIATWAVLLDQSLTGDLISFNNQTNSLSFNRNITVNDPFMIVPVTDTTSNGVVRFSSVSFTHPADEVLQSFQINFTLDN